MKKLFLIPLILFSLISLQSLSDNKNKLPVCKEFLDFSVNKCIQIPEGISMFERKIINNCAPNLEFRNEIYYDKLKGFPYTGKARVDNGMGLMINGQKCGFWTYNAFMLITKEYISCNKLCKNKY